MIIATAINELASQVMKEPSVSLETAAWWFDRASWFLAGSLLIGFICTVLIIWMGVIKEHHWDLAREQANSRIGTLFKDGEKLKKEAEQLRKDTAEANARSAELKLKLAEVEERNEKRAMSRGMLVKSLAACKEVLKDKPKGKVEIRWLKAFGDGDFLSFLIEDCFHAPPGEEGWTIVGRGPIDELPNEANRNEGITVIGQQHGIFPFNVLAVNRPSDVLSDVIAHALMVALDTSIIRISVGTDRSMPEDLVRIFIGAK